MFELFQLNSPWWHFVVRGIVVYVLVLGLMRLSGKRAVGQFTPFDLVMLILIGNAVQNGINGGENSLSGAFLMAGTLVGLNYLTALVTVRSVQVERIIEGVPVVLARNGHVYQEILRRELVSRDDFDEALRTNGVRGIDDVDVAILETNGKISVIPKREA
ncbi:MAG: DUF421 domain-containing protein [Pirellulales bacterium]